MCGQCHHILLAQRPVGYSTYPHPLSLRITFFLPTLWLPKKNSWHKVRKLGSSLLWRFDYGCGGFPYTTSCFWEATFLLIAATLHLISNRAMNSASRDGPARRYTPSHEVERTMEAVCRKDLVQNRLSCDLTPILDTRRSGEKFDQKP